MSYNNPGIFTATNEAVSSDVAYSDGAMNAMDDLTLFPPAGNLKSHSSKALGSRRDEDLLFVGGGFNTLPDLSFYQPAQQTTTDDHHGQANYTDTVPPFDQPHWALNYSAGYQGDGAPIFTRFVQPLDPPIYNAMAAVADTTAEAGPAAPFSATGPSSARPESCPWEPAPMGSQPSIQRDRQTSQTGPALPATMNSLPSGPLFAEGDRKNAAPKERGRRKNKFSQEKKDSVRKRRDGKTTCIGCRYSKREV